MGRVAAIALPIPTWQNRGPSLFYFGGTAIHDHDPQLITLRGALQSGTL